LVILLLLAACETPVDPGSPPDQGTESVESETADSADAVMQAATFTNPIKAQAGADPWLTYHEGNYYLITTSGGTTLSMRTSPTLAGLDTAPDVEVWSGADTPNACCNMWAPEIHFFDGHWYLYFTAGQNVEDFIPTQRNHVLESAGDDPLGPYTYKGALNPGTWQLDASPLQIDGNLYLMGTYNSGGTQNLSIQAMTNPYTLTGSVQTLAVPTHDWERQGAPVNEGPEALYHDGRTFVVFSASGCWTPDYKLGLLEYTGGDPLDPASWTKSAEPVFQRSDANGVFGPGHNGFFTSPDGTERWIVYHANDSASDGCDNGRSTRAQRFTWNDDGTPNVGEPVELGVTLDAPSGEAG
jgi:GH43 family beta-xylosidase